MNDDGLVNFRHHMLTPEKVNFHARRNLITIPDTRQPKWQIDPDYYAADRIRQKRRQKYSSSRPLTIVRDERRVVPPPTNGELQ